MVAANSIASAVKNLAIVLCGGIAGGGAVLIGKYLGNNDTEMAKRAGNRINLYALIFGVLAGVTVLLMKPLVFRMVDLNTSAHGYLDGMLYVCAYYCIGKSINSTIIGGVFPAGGDPKFGFWMDTIVMWGIILPLSYVSAFVWHIHPVLLYVVISLDEVIKLPAAIIRYRQYKWLKNITRETAFAS
jgi:Na+-driven multidrug efflux pump